MMRNFILILVFIVISIDVFGGGYKIEVKINGVSDTTVLLGYHFGPKKFVVDTIRVDKNGYGVFKGDEELEGGIYLIIPPNMKYFEILIDKDQKFMVETDTVDYTKNMKITGSADNEDFNEWQRFMGSLQTEVQDLYKRKDENKDNKDSVKVIQDKIDELMEKKNKKEEDYIKENPDKLLTAILKMMQKPEIPDPPKDEDGNITDSTFQYRYYKEHFFDNIDLTDARLLRTPIFHGKINEYFRRVTMQVPDSINAEADKIIAKAKVNKDVFMYIVRYLVNLYSETKLMGMDAVYVHVAENYYLTGEADWVDSTFLEKMQERVNKIKPNLIGAKAPDLKLYTYNFIPVSLYGVEAEYTILLFWEPDCGHCKKILPALHNYYKDTLIKHDVKVFAVCTHNDTAKYYKFIKDHKLYDWINAFDPLVKSKFRDYYDIYSTPVLYLLNDKKEIVAKRVDLNTIKELLGMKLGFKEEEKDDKDADKEKEDNKKPGKKKKG